MYRHQPLIGHGFGGVRRGAGVRGVGPLRDAWDSTRLRDARPARLEVARLELIPVARRVVLATTRPRHGSRDRGLTRRRVPRCLHSSVRQASQRPAVGSAREASRSKVPKPPTSRGLVVRRLPRSAAVLRDGGGGEPAGEPGCLCGCPRQEVGEEEARAAGHTRRRRCLGSHRLSQISASAGDSRHALGDERGRRSCRAASSPDRTVGGGGGRSGLTGSPIDAGARAAATGVATCLWWPVAGIASACGPAATAGSDGRRNGSSRGGCSSGRHRRATAGEAHDKRAS